MLEDFKFEHCGFHSASDPERIDIDFHETIKKMKLFLQKFIRSFVIMILLNSSQSFYGQYKYLFWARPDKLWNIITEYIMRVRNREKEERGKEMEDRPASCVNIEESKRK